MVSFTDAEAMTDADLAAAIYANDIANGFERPLTRLADHLLDEDIPMPIPPTYRKPPGKCSHVTIHDNTIHVPDAFERYYGPR